MPVLSRPDKLFRFFLLIWLPVIAHVSTFTYGLHYATPALYLLPAILLLAPDYQRDHAVADDWNRIVCLANGLKVSFPVNATGAVKNELADGDDWSLEEASDAKSAIGSVMVEMMKGLSRFTARSSMLENHTTTETR